MVPITIHATNASAKTTIAGAPSTGFTDFILRQLSIAGLRAKIVVNEIETVAAALAGGLIDVETALAMLGEADLLPLIEASSC
jgi:hypothetical protein